MQITVVLRHTVGAWVLVAVLVVLVVRRVGVQDLVGELVRRDSPDAAPDPFDDRLARGPGRRVLNGLDRHQIERHGARPAQPAERQRLTGVRQWAPSAQRLVDCHTPERVVLVGDADSHAGERAFEFSAGDGLDRLELAVGENAAKLLGGDRR